MSTVDETQVPGCPKCGAPAQNWRPYGRCASCKEPFSAAFDAQMEARRSDLTSGPVAGHSGQRAAIVMNRYRDSYRVARTIVTIGNTIKILGGILAALILGAFVLAGGSIASQSGAAGLLSLVSGALVAVVVGLLFWLFGVLVSSQGQVLLASLDVAVNGSPFLVDVQRADVMGIG